MLRVLAAAWSGVVGWLGAPWTAANDEAEQDELAEALGKLEAREALRSGQADLTRRRIADKHRRRRLRARLFVALIFVVAFSAAVSVFTSNRVSKAIAVAATASAVPTALYLGLRRSEA